MNFQEKHIIRSNIETCPKNHIWYVIMSLKLWNSFLKVDHETLRKNISYGGPFHIRSIILCSTNGFDIAWYFAISSVCSKNSKSLVVIKTEHKSSVLKHTFTKGDVSFFFAITYDHIFFCDGRFYWVLFSRDLKAKKNPRGK